MKKFALVALATALLVLPACGDKLPKGAIVKVGDGVVTQQQFDTLIAQQKQSASQPGAVPFPSPGTYSYKMLTANIVDYLVTQKLIEQGAADRNITVSDDDINKQLEAIYKQYGGEQKVMEILKKQNMTLDQVKQYMKDQALYQKVYSAVTANAKPTDDQLRAYYDQNKASYDSPASRNVRHVLVDSKAQAERVRALLEANPSDANWKKVAKQYSKDPGTKDRGGELGPVARGQGLDAAFEKAAFALKPHVISQPVKSQYGWHVMEVTSVNPARESKFETAKPRIEQALAAQMTQKAWDDFLKKAKADANIVYAPGYDPAQLTIPPSPLPTAAPPAPAPTKTKAQ
jgi:foldase protein PrsA